MAFDQSIRSASKLSQENAQRQLGAGPLRLIAILTFLASFPSLGCVSVKGPERINVNNSRPARVDSRHVPHINTVEEGRVELDKAYQNIRYLEDRNSRLERDQD